MLPAVFVPLEQGLRTVFHSPLVSTQIPLLRHLETEVEAVERQNTKSTLEVSLPSRIPFFFLVWMTILASLLFNLLFLLVEDLFFSFPPLPVDLDTISGKYLWRQK